MTPNPMMIRFTARSKRGFRWRRRVSNPNLTTNTISNSARRIFDSKSVVLRVDSKSEPRALHQLPARRLHVATARAPDGHERWTLRQERARKRIQLGVAGGAKARARVLVEGDEVDIVWEIRAKV